MVSEPTNPRYRKMHLYPAFVIGFLSNHVSLSCMLSSVPGVCRFAYHLSIFDTRKQLKEFITRNSLHPFN